MGQDGNIVQFKIKKHTALKKLMATYCERAGLALQVSAPSCPTSRFPPQTQLLAALSDLLAYPSFLAGCFFSYIKINIVVPNQNLPNWFFFQGV
jgi:hypothetical protein